MRLVPAPTPRMPPLLERPRARIGYARSGVRVNAGMWAGRTMEKSRRSTVAIVSTARRSAMAMTVASTVPRGQIGVLPDQCGHPREVSGGVQFGDLESAAGNEGLEEQRFGGRAAPRADQVGRLGDHQVLG